MQTWKDRIGTQDYHGGDKPDEADFMVIIHLFLKNLNLNPWLNSYSQFWKLNIIRVLSKDSLKINFLQLHTDGSLECKLNVNMKRENFTNDQRKQN